MSHLSVRGRGLILPLLLASALAAPELAAAPSTLERVPSATLPELEPDLLARAQRGTADGVWVYLRSQADLSAARTASTHAERTQAVVAALKAHAERTQAPLLQELRHRGVEVRPFFVVNALLVRNVDVALLEVLASRPEVARLEYNHTFQMLPPSPGSAGNPTLTEGVEWHLQAINAPAVWEAGTRGEGVVVAGNDTGVEWSHAAIQRQYRGSSSAGVDHNYNWHDGTSSGRQGAPYDDHGHGTFTVGELVGDDGAGNQIGAAPGARWIACKNMNGAGIGTVESYTSCFEWFISPTNSDGQSPRPELAPHVINNSWGCPPSEGCHKESLHDIVNNVQAAGIMLVFSAGNAGPSCGTVEDPPATFSEVLSVGATDQNNELATFSSRGPSTYDRGTKPDIAAPGQDVRSCNSRGGYTSMSGTSMASPLVAGVAALVWSAAPQLIGDIPGTTAVLLQSATPKRGVRCGVDRATGLNNMFGAGLVNAEAAVDLATRR